MSVHRWGIAALVLATAALMTAGPAAAASPPKVSKVAPSSGRTAGGATVTVSGTGFSHVSKVLFGTTAGTSVKVDSSGKLTAHAPKHAAGTVDVRVETTSGESAKTTKDHFTYYAPPAITAVSPKTGALAGGTTVTVTGTGFHGISKVEFGTSAGTHVVLDSTTKLTVVTPKHVLGTVRVEVIGSYGTSPATTKDEYAFAPTWVATRAPLPVAPKTIPNSALDSVSCPVAGSCVAVGSYATDNGTGEIETLSGGVWRARAEPVPANAAANPDVSLEGVSCPSLGACVAVGSYVDKGGNVFGLIDTLSGGAWTATQANLPSNFETPQDTQLTGVHCVSSAFCVAIGSYSATTDGADALIETLASGVWTGTEAPLPANADPSPGPVLNAVACAAAGSCYVVGEYVYDLSGDNTYGNVIDTLASGVWTGASAPLPSGHSATPQSDLKSIACGSSTTCVAVGAYTRTSGFYGLIESLSSGTWTGSTAPFPVVIPSGDDPMAALQSVACPGSGSCVAVGGFLNGDNNDDTFGWVVTLADGKWTATQPPAPSIRGGTNSAGLSDVVCAGVGACSDTGTFADDTNEPHASLGTLTTGKWTVVEAPLPPATSASTSQVFVNGLSCPKANGCTVAGEYTSGFTANFGYLASQE